MIRRFVSAGMLVLGLAACAAPMAEETVANDPPPRGTAAVAKTPKIPSTAPLSKQREEAATVFNPTRRPLDLTPEKLLGFGGKTLTLLLGEPMAIRSEPPAEVWQYKTETCILDLFLYGEAGELRVAHVSARSTGLLDTTPKDCLDKVRAVAATS